MSKFKKHSDQTCAVDGCVNRASGIHKYCDKHRQRVAKHGHPTTPYIDLRRTEGGAITKWIINFIEDDIRTNEDLAESLAWLKSWISQESRNPSKGQPSFRKVYDYTDDEGYIKIMAGVAALVAISLDNPRRLETGLPLVRQSANWVLHSTTPASRSSKNSSTGKRSTGYYTSPYVLDKVGQTILQEIGSDLAYLANRAARLSPFFMRKKGL